MFVWFFFNEVQLFMWRKERKPFFPEAYKHISWMSIVVRFIDIPDISQRMVTKTGMHYIKSITFNEQQYN